LNDDSDGRTFRFPRSACDELREANRTPNNGVVRSNFGVSKDEQGQDRTRSWFEDPHVNRGKLDDLVRSFGDPLAGERAVPQDGEPAAADGAGLAAKLSGARIFYFSAEDVQDALTTTDWAILTAANPKGNPAADTDNRKAVQPLESV